MGDLNDSQKRYTLSVLSVVHQHLEAIENLRQGQPPLFGKLNRDITAAESEALKSFASALRAEILDLDARFRLQHPHQPLSVRWNIDTHLRFAVVELQELSRSKLSGYGALDEPTYQDLQIQIDRLRRMLAMQIKKLGPQSVRDGQ